MYIYGTYNYKINIVGDSHQAINLCASTVITHLEAYSFNATTVQCTIESDGASCNKAEKCYIASRRQGNSRVRCVDQQSAGDVQSELSNDLYYCSVYLLYPFSFN